MLALPIGGTYSISKFAVEGMMKVLAEELKNTHVRANCINPGGTRTDMRAKAFPGEDPHNTGNPRRHYAGLSVFNESRKPRCQWTDTQGPAALTV